MIAGRVDVDLVGTSCKNNRNSRRKVQNWNTFRITSACGGNAMTSLDVLDRDKTCSIGAPCVFTYRRVKTPNRKPRPTAMATAESGFCRIASSAWFAVSTALSWARLICLLAMRETVEVRL